MINIARLAAAAKNFKNSQPFDHCVIEGFFDDDVALEIEKECPKFEDSLWHVYDNSIEVKKTTNVWYNFGPKTYQALAYLNSPAFVNMISDHLRLPGLKADVGLHGGGWHVHGNGGLLNPHLDYSIHPKLGLQRKLNLIVYLNSSWQDDWGGQLGLWEDSQDSPGSLIKSVTPRFNTAILFDTTQKSWHGLVETVKTPPGQVRRSLAVYYMVEPQIDADKRGKALYAPTKDQQGDDEVLDLIKKRADLESAHETYVRKRK